MTYDRDPRYVNLLNAMQGFDGHPRFYELLAQIACVHSDKNHDYAGADPLANLRACQEYGIDPIEGVVTRITDKDMRFKHWFRRRREASVLRVNEGVTDTLQDRAVYTLLLIIMLAEALRSGVSLCSLSTLD